MKILKIALILLLLISFKSYSQEPVQEPIKMFIGDTDKEIRVYLDSLVGLFPDNEYVKIEKSTTTRGDLFLTVNFPMSGEEKAGCITIFAIFQRINGTEVCMRQAIMGTDKSAYRNLTYVKDNYKKHEEDKWIAPLRNAKGETLPTFFVVAGYEKKDKSYTLSYDFKALKEQDK